ncbi:hypothetical protein RDABS01_025959 [Bienertia sinuspersici]
MKNTICYKCHGQGHMAMDCKTNMNNQGLVMISDNMEVLNDPKAWDNLPMDEIIDSTTNKKERRDQVLNMRCGTNLQKGDYVWLSLNGPFRIQKKIGYEMFKVLLGNGACATLTSNDLVPCLLDET